METLQSFLGSVNLPKTEGMVLILLMLFARDTLLARRSIDYGFVLDDKEVITENAVTQGGIDSLRTIWAKVLQRPSSEYSERCKNRKTTESNLFCPILR